MRPKTIEEMQKELEALEGRGSSSVRHERIATQEDIAFAILDILASKGATAADVLKNEPLRKEIVEGIRGKFRVDLSGGDLIKDYLAPMVEGKWEKEWRQARTERKAA